jgi:hypothetical protein
VPFLSSLSSALTPTFSTKRSDALLYTLDANDNLPGSPLRFQYFPESITDTKAINWAPKDIPGGSLPLYQWVSSGERTISFTATFSTDVDCASIENATEGGGTLVSPEGRDKYNRLAKAGAEDRNVDIRAAIAWLRSHMLPHYGGVTENGVTFTQPPRKIRLYLPNSGIGLVGGDCASSNRDSITCIMTGCEISWTAFFPSGMPRIATVQLAFSQIAQHQGMVDFPKVGTVMSGEIGQEGTKTFGYKLGAK